MKKYNRLLQIATLQHKIDHRYGKGKHQALLVFLLFMCLTLTSCQSDKTLQQEQAERQQQQERTRQNPRTSTQITINNSGQIRELEDEPVDLNDGLQRITRAYFAKKTVTQNGSHIVFTQINDSILGKTVYLVLETQNMTDLDIDVVIKPATSGLTGGTDTLTVMHLSPPTQAGQRQTSTETQLMTASVGNFDALRNNQGSYTHYTNLGDHADKAIIKLQLRPATRADYDTWARNLGSGTANLEIVVERTDNNLCAYGDSDEEVAGAGTFLNDDTARFSVSCKNFYEIYHKDNTYNFLSGTYRIRRAMQGGGQDQNVQRRIGLIDTSYTENNQRQYRSNEVVYFYYNSYDIEHEITNCALSVVDERTNGNCQLLSVPAGYTRRENAPAGGNAQYNYHYANGDIVTTGNHRNGATGRCPRNQLRILSFSRTGSRIELVRMADSLNRNEHGNLINYTFSNSQRRFCNPACYAAFIGVLAECRLNNVQSTGMCFGDATSYPSVSHPNGDSVDTVYLNNQNNSIALAEAFRTWGFTYVIAGSHRNFAYLATRVHARNSEHDNHLHSGDFPATNIQIINS